MSLSASMVEASSFPAVPLGELVEFLDHRRRPITAANREPGPYPYYGANGVQDHVADFLFDEPLVLLAEDGGHFDEPERGVAYGIEGKAWVNNHAHVLRPSGRVDFRFLVRALENYDLRPLITGSTRAKLTKSGASRALIPLPPLAEQERIAAILDKADELQAKRSATVAHLDSLTQAIFLDMFGDPRTAGGRWRTAPLASLVRHPITRGIDQPGPEDPSGLPYIRTSDFSAQPIQLKDLSRAATAVAAKFSRSVCEADDLVMCIRATVGPVIQLGTELAGVNLSRGTARIAPGGDVAPAYLRECLRSDALQSQIKKTLRGATFLQIPLAEVKALEVPVPPRGVQERFCEQAARVDLLRAVSRHSQNALAEQSASLQARAFQGEL